MNSLQAIRAYLKVETRKLGVSWSNTDELLDTVIPKSPSAKRRRKADVELLEEKSVIILEIVFADKQSGSSSGLSLPTFQAMYQEGLAVKIVGGGWRLKLTLEETMDVQVNMHRYWLSPGFGPSPSPLPAPSPVASPGKEKADSPGLFTFYTAADPSLQASMAARMCKSSSQVQALTSSSSYVYFPCPSVAGMVAFMCSQEGQDLHLNIHSVESIEDLDMYSLSYVPKALSPLSVPLLV